MTIFDFLFLFVAFCSLVTLIAVAVQALRGHGKSSLRILSVYAICIAIYLGVCVATAATSDQRVLVMGEPMCYDDWCIQIDSAHRLPAPDAVTYDATFRVFSRARRVTQREKDVTVLLLDDRGNRYAPTPSPGQPPFDVQLGPGDSVSARREFRAPSGVRPIALVIAHTGFQIGWLVIGEGQSLFHKEPIVRLH